MYMYQAESLCVDKQALVAEGQLVAHRNEGIQKKGNGIDKFCFLVIAR
jgi:hypothetical protein